MFKAADLKEAMAMVKDELGRDAVILHTKRYRQGGFLGYKSKEVVEVTAAIDDTPRRPHVKLPPPRRRTKGLAPDLPPAAPLNPLPRQSAPRQVLAQYKTAGTEAGVSLARSAELAARLGEAPVEMAFVPTESAPRSAPLRSSYQQEPAAAYPAVSSVPQQTNEQLKPMTVPIVSAPPVSPEPSPAVASPEPSARASAPSTPRIIKAAPTPTAPAAAAPPSAGSVAAVSKAEQESGEKIQALEDELAQMRKMLRQVMSQPRTENEILSLQDALKAQEVNEAVMQDVIRKIPQAMLLAPHDSEEAHKALSEYLHGALKTGTGIGLKDGRPKIVALIGTTGVGKTTTIAKIAARFVLEKGVSVALITADTYRISAVEQLKTYSDIIGLPLEIVYSAVELKTAIRKHRDKKLILIDTAGRSQNNEYQMQELKDFLAEEPAIEKHLVMSATTKARDAEKILERFSACRPDRLLFTKTDETDSLGFIVNLLFDRRIALSYLTNGQSVPDDIEPARPEVLAKLLLR